MSNVKLPSFKNLEESIRKSKESNNYYYNYPKVYYPLIQRDNFFRKNKFVKNPQEVSLSNLVKSVNLVLECNKFIMLMDSEFIFCDCSKVNLLIAFNMNKHTNVISINISNDNIKSFVMSQIVNEISKQCKMNDKNKLSLIILDKKSGNFKQSQQFRVVICNKLMPKNVRDLLLFEKRISNVIYKCRK